MVGDDDDAMMDLTLVRTATLLDVRREGVKAEVEAIMAKATADVKINFIMNI